MTFTFYLAYQVRFHLVGQLITLLVCIVTSLLVHQASLVQGLDGVACKVMIVLEAQQAPSSYISCI